MFKNGDEIVLRGRVLDTHDRGNVVVQIGETGHVSIPLLELEEIARPAFARIESVAAEAPATEGVADLGGQDSEVQSGAAEAVTRHVGQ